MKAFTPRVIGTMGTTTVVKPNTEPLEYWFVGGSVKGNVNNPGPDDCTNQFTRLVVADTQAAASALASQLGIGHVQPASPGSTAFSKGVTLTMPDSAGGHSDQSFGNAVVTNYQTSSPGLMAKTIQVFQNESDEPDTVTYGKKLCSAIRHNTPLPPPMS